MSIFMNLALYELTYEKNNEFHNINPLSLNEAFTIRKELLKNENIKDIVIRKYVK